MLGSIITQNQSAFVAKRQIHDNILMTHEDFHHFKMKKKGRKYELALKLDMNNAYDRVDLDFLQAVLTKLGFYKVWLGWIMECVSFVS